MSILSAITRWRSLIWEYGKRIEKSLISRYSKQFGLDTNLVDWAKLSIENWKVAHLGKGQPVVVANLGIAQNILRNHGFGGQGRRPIQGPRGNQTCQTASRSDPHFWIHEEVVFGLFLCIDYSSLILQHYCAAVDVCIERFFGCISLWFKYSTFPRIRTETLFSALNIHQLNGWRKKLRNAPGVRSWTDLFVCLLLYNV